MKNRRNIVELLETRRLLAANLVISEFLASNNNNITDSFGDHSDWLEIHNAGDAAADLHDYFLTDNAGDPEQWRFPEENLAAGGYVVVFASGRDIAVAGSELHTNFKIGADGEYLGLIRVSDDQPQFDYSPTFPPQTPDVSYGLFNADDPNSARIFFPNPTPGAANVPTAFSPTFSVQGKVFSGTLPVSLSDSTPGAVIHYTTDNSVPTASSPAYSTPLSLTQSTPIRAIAIASGYSNSAVDSQTYERVDSTVTSVQNANLPVVIIDTYGNTINDANFVAGSATFMNTTNGTTDLLNGTADYQGRIGIHIRGSTSEAYPKQQYSVETWDESNNDKKVSLLGMPADSDWVLDAYTELSLMQNQLAYKWANETGHYASKTQFVEVYMSTANNPNVGNTTTINYTSNYLGVYILEEKIKADDVRVDVGTEVSASDPNGGYIIEQDRYTGNDYFTTPQGVHMVLDDPDDTTLESYISSSWDSFENALFTGSAGPNQPWDTPGNANYYGNFIDVNSFVDYFLVNEMTRNIDSFWLSTFYTKSSKTGLISAGPVWDFNLAPGASNYNFSSNAEGWDTDTLTPFPGAPGVSGFNPQDPYFQRLLTDPNFVQAVSDRWNQLRQGVFSTSNLTADVDSDTALLSDNTGSYPVGTNPTSTASPVTRNFTKWKELGVYVTTDGLYDPNGSWIQDVNLMKNWLTARVNWMDSQFIPSPTTTPGGNFSNPVSVTMTPQGPATLTDTQLIGPNSTIYYKVPTANISGWQTLSATSQPSGWSTGTTGLGYDTQTSPVSFLPFIKTNVQSSMFNTNADVFTLMNFTVSNPAAIQALVLKVQYDDGYTAWINGVRVADANSPENTNPVFNTNAAGSGDDTQAITYREYDVTAIKGLLKAGNNTLAIQGMNSGTGSADFLLAPTLYARTYTYPAAGSVYYTTDGSDPRTNTGAISATAHLYSAAVNVSASTEILARTYVNGSWSALSDQIYNFDPNVLKITELMYNPPAPPAGSPYTAQDFEYVELKNIGSSPLNLNGIIFSDAIVFSFPNTMLPAGAYGVVVKNPAAFESRYGTSVNILGTYTGSLNNGGENVATSNGFGQVLESFDYNNKAPWPTAPDGGGPSLEINSPTADPTNPGDWHASTSPIGSPGVDGADSSAPTVSASSFQYQTGQSITIQFSKNVNTTTLLPANLSVQPATGPAIQPTSVTFNPANNTATYVFASLIPDGDFQATLAAKSVKDLGDNALAFNYSLSDFVLTGDANHDGTVNALDFNALATNFGATGATYSQGDFNYDGLVTTADFAQMAAKFGAVVPPPAAPLAAASPAASLFADRTIQDYDSILA